MNNFLCSIPHYYNVMLFAKTCWLWLERMLREYWLPVEVRMIVCTEYDAAHSRPPLAARERIQLIGWLNITGMLYYYRFYPDDSSTERWFVEMYSHNCDFRIHIDRITGKLYTSGFLANHATYLWKNCIRDAPELMQLLAELRSLTCDLQRLNRAKIITQLYRDVGDTMYCLGFNEKYRAR